MFGKIPARGSGEGIKGLEYPDPNMPQTVNVNPTSEHALYLKLFVTNGGGW